MLGEAALGRFFGDIGVAEAKVRWAEYMVGFSATEVKRGLAELADRKFMPTLGEFRNMCRPCLDPEYAWHEAGACLRQRDAGEKGDWTHPAVWRAACTMSMEVRSGDFQRNRARWSFELRKELQRGFADGVPVPVARIENTPLATKGPTPEQRAALDALRGKLRRTPASDSATTGEPE